MSGSTLPPILWLPIAWLGFVGCLMFLVFLIGLWEKRMAWPYEVVEAEAPIRPVAEFDARDPYAPSVALAQEAAVAPSEYSLRAGHAAAGLGFTHLATYRDGRGGLYQLRSDFWLSRERYVLAQVATGSMAKIPYLTTSLHTRLEDGTWLVTLDNDKGTHVDLTRQTIEALNPGVDFTSLVRWHRARVLAARVPASPLSADDPLGQFRAFRTGRVDLLAHRGLVSYVDATRNAHRFTIRGAAIYTCRMHARMYRRRFWPDTRRQFPPAAGPAPAPAAPPAELPDSV